MEQTLGHRAHGQTLLESLTRDTSVEPLWAPVDFDSEGLPWSMPLVRHNWSLRGSMKAAREMNRMIEEGVDAFFVHTITISLLTAKFARAKPLVLSLDATPENYDLVGSWYGHKAAPGPIEALKRRFRGRALRRASAVVTWCDWAKKSLERDYGVDPEMVHVIHPGASIDRFSFGSERRVKNGNGRARLLFVGGDFHRKGGNILLQAYRAALKDVAELHLVTEEAVESEAGVQVYRGLGPNSPELISLYESADVFVLPTLGDCFPVVMGEAMAAGLPIVTTDVGAVSEAVHEGENGFVVPAGDDVALVSALNVLAHDQELRVRMGKVGRRLAEKHHDSRRNAARVIDVIKSVCEERVGLEDAQPEAISA